MQTELVKIGPSTQADWSGPGMCLVLTEENSYCLEIPDLDTNTPNRKESYESRKQAAGQSWDNEDIK